ncbi:hypothetical protein Vsou_24260 [Vulcanisaeta souniana JCM 11219]|uniref:Uncharacterized protein n=1 Tax=Vulcanisaeta souniana JCM 11219 TaxID=1293586 RepID=A0ABN6STV4_9CREN|nr:hypothetical protein Vsou_24260 [Vulcanisaeta souniana JCM 11219]
MELKALGVLMIQMLILSLGLAIERAALYPPNTVGGPLRG